MKTAYAFPLSFLRLTLRECVCGKAGDCRKGWTANGVTQMSLPSFTFFLSLLHAPSKIQDPRPLFKVMLSLFPHCLYRSRPGLRESLADDIQTPPPCASGTLNAIGPKPQFIIIYVFILMLLYRFIVLPSPPNDIRFGFTVTLCVDNWKKCSSITHHIYWNQFNFKLRTAF